MNDFSFKNWMAKQESTAFTRRRHAALLGLAPEIPDAEIHRHSTFPFVKELKDKKRKKKSKKKDKQLDEGKRSKPLPDRKVDDWLTEIEGLRPDIETLKSVINKKREKTPKTGKPPAKEGEDVIDSKNRESKKADSPDQGRKNTSDPKQRDQSDEEE